MSSDQFDSFTKDNLDIFLKDLGKAFRKANGKTMPAEIILIGGASILVNYGFRDSTTDVDAIIRASSAMKDAINEVGDKHGLPNGWLNTDFTKTSSYSAKLDEISVPYKSFANVLHVRYVSGEYLIAMKLCAGRQYKHDLSDIVGILYEHQKSEKPITMIQIETAVNTLYGGWDTIPQHARQFLEQTMEDGDYERIFNSIQKDEEKSHDIMIEFQKNYPKVTNAENINDILATLKEKKRQESES